MKYNYNNYNDNYNDIIVSPAKFIGLNNCIQEIIEENKKGKLHILYANYCKKYGENKNLANLNIPYIENNNIKNIFIINNTDDVERIVENHIKKMPNLKPFVLNSIISTTDENNWKEQRSNYQNAFSLENSIKPLITKSNNIAKLGVNKLLELSNYCKNPVNINDFFLNETLAQLQLVLFGVSNDFEKETNEKIRDTFSGNNIRYAEEYGNKLLKESYNSVGPLGNEINSLIEKNTRKSEMIGNALIFSFAGHDTTGNTLTWLIYELSKNYTLQKKLHDEVKKFWINQGNNNIVYDDFKRLPFMTRCIMETLRLWSPIPNGTFRELGEDEYIVGIDNKKICLKKGTYVQIPNWYRHRDKILWGDDSEEFNPNREFKDDEIWDDLVIASYNPNSKRFSPFTYGPRDCIGKNFSQIEMRLILLNLLNNFEFELTNDQLKMEKYKENISFNSFTLGPRNIYNENLYNNKLGMYVNIKNIKSKL